MAERNLYYSTNLRAPDVTFREALLNGLAPDGGLYMPRNIPGVKIEELMRLSGKSYPEVAFEILSRLLRDEVSKETLLEVCYSVYNFNVPVEKVSGNNYVMRLDQGPTASFKDFAALMMGKLMESFLKIKKSNITILTATSGDTGSAVANAFYGLENINVIILYPACEISEMQRKQMTTLKRNVRVLSVDGNFDDCQRLVKRAFLDQSLSHLNLSSANSINIGRLLPQSVYYFWGWLQVASEKGRQTVFSVPCGNLGNLAGGLIAKRMGLPVGRFIISTNKNDEVAVFLKSGKFEIISPSRNCISSAMNVGNPSNLARIIALYGGIMDEKSYISRQPDFKRLSDDLYAVTVSDEATRETIKESYRQYRLLLEPHGAVAWKGLQEYLKQNKESKGGDNVYISLETAHPAKFPKEISDILKIVQDLPHSLSGLSDKEEEYISLDNNYNSLTDFMNRNY